MNDKINLSRRELLLHDLAEIKRYKTIYPGYPIWGMSLPAIVRSFLTHPDFSGITRIYRSGAIYRARFLEISAINRAATNFY